MSASPASTTQTQAQPQTQPATSPQEQVGTTSTAPQTDKPKSQAPNKRIHIRRLPFETTREELEELCASYGRVTNVECRKGYGLVTFESEEDAEFAIYRLKGKVWHNMELTADWSTPQQPKEKNAAPVQKRDDKDPHNKRAKKAELSLKYLTPRNPATPNPSGSSGPSKNDQPQAQPSQQSPQQSPVQSPQQSHAQGQGQGQNQGGQQQSRRNRGGNRGGRGGPRGGRGGAPGGRGRGRRGGGPGRNNGNNGNNFVDNESAGGSDNQANNQQSAPANNNSNNSNNSNNTNSNNVNNGNNNNNTGNNNNSNTGNNNSNTGNNNNGNNAGGNNNRRNRKPRGAKGRKNGGLFEITVKNLDNGNVTYTLHMTESEVQQHIAPLTKDKPSPKN